MRERIARNAQAKAWAYVPARAKARAYVRLVLALVLTTCAFAQAKPARIISLVPGATEMLFAIGAGPRVVAVSSYDKEPPEVTSLPRVGALLDPDVERILSLKPDLIVVYGSQHDLVRQLQRTGVAGSPTSSRRFARWRRGRATPNRRRAWSSRSRTRSPTSAPASRDGRDREQCLCSAGNPDR